MQNRYTLESGHEIGYRWELDAPDGISSDEVEELCDAIVNYTDEPTQENFNDMLEDISFLEDYSLNQANWPLYKQITLSCKVVHRSAFTQSFEKVD